MEVLLLGYEILAETALKLMNCVSIGSGKWLFIDANVPCMQWWQYLLLAYIAIFLIPFIIVLYYGSYQPQRSSTTWGEFIAACMIPLPFLIYWFIKKLTKRPRQESTRGQVVNRDVLEILHGPFRPPSGNDFLAFAPALVSPLVAFSVLSQLVRLLRFLTSRLRYCFSMFFSFLWIRTKSEDLFYMLLNSTDTENENKALLNFFNVFCL